MTIWHGSLTRERARHNDLHNICSSLRCWPHNAAKQRILAWLCVIATLNLNGSLSDIVSRFSKHILYVIYITQQNCWKEVIMKVEYKALNIQWKPLYMQILQHNNNNIIFMYKIDMFKTLSTCHMHYLQRKHSKGQCTHI